MKRARQPTSGQPAPFTPEQVEALNAGKANLPAVEKLLKAHRQPRLSAPPEKKTKRGPIPLTRLQLRQLGSSPETPASVTRTLEKSAPPSEKLKKPDATPRQSARPEYKPPAIAE